MKAETLTLIVALALAACGGRPSSPTQPSSTSSSPPPSVTSPTPATSPAQVGVTDWSVTQRFGSVTGPDNCWVRTQRERWSPAVFPDLPMKVTRADGSIKLDSAFFQVNYTGTFVGSEFSAKGTIPLEGSRGFSCPDGTVVQQLPGVSSLSGHFSADDRLLTATEVNSYPLVSGETVTYRWDWQATQKN
jgi:hypothetical protein